VTFDEIGDRRTAEYQVINILPGAHQQVVGNCQIDSEIQSTLKLTLDRRKMVFPGGSREVPKGFIVATHLKVNNQLFNYDTFHKYVIIKNNLIKNMKNKSN